MRPLTVALPLISFLAALAQGLCPMDPNLDAGADPRTARIMSKYKRRSALRLGTAPIQLLRGDTAGAASVLVAASSVSDGTP